jgi:multidrug efflux pump subunit AcrB
LTIAAIGFSEVTITVLTRLAVLQALLQERRIRSYAQPCCRLPACDLSRFRPIALTAISTVLGLIPIAPTVFWDPMAFSVMGGCWFRRS